MEPIDANRREVLWAPWRLAYITTNKDQPQAEGCFLCRYAATPEQDSENLVVARAKGVLTVLNRFPYNNGHLLVAPTAHKASLTELDDSELLACQHALQRMIEIIGRTMFAEGFNIGLNLGKVAGAGVPVHLHWHIVPRWNGDVNYMPALAGVSVIPQSLVELHRILTEALA